MRRASALALLCVLMSAGAPASAAPRAQVRVVFVNGTSLSDWARPSLGGFASLLRTASVATLSTRTERESDDPVTTERAAIATALAGYRPESGARPVNELTDALSNVASVRESTMPMAAADRAISSDESDLQIGRASCRERVYVLV